MIFRKLLQTKTIDMEKTDTEILKLRLECLKLAWEFHKAIPKNQDSPEIEDTMRRMWAIVEDKKRPEFRPKIR